jgi:hypothetical protein
MSRYVGRPQWGARPSVDPLPGLVKSQILGVAIHYSAMGADEQAAHVKCPGRVAGIQAYHQDHNGWLDIAYNHLVCKHGYIFTGRGFGKRSAAQGTNAGNDGYHAVCFLGDDTAGRDDLTHWGRTALLVVCGDYFDRYRAAMDVRPHSFFHPTACPGDELRKFVTRLRSLIAVA